MIEKWWLNLYLISQAARPATCTQYESPSWWDGHTCTKTGHWTQHTSTALRSLWNGKAMTYFWLDLTSCTTVHAALGSAHTVCGSQLMRESQPFRRLYTSHFYCPFLLCLESVMSDKMCVCVCVCVRTDSFQLKLGSQIDFSVFSAPLFGIFDVSQCTCSQNQCLFPLPLLVPLALLSNIYMLPLPLSACFPRLAWICVPPFVKYGFSSGASIRSRTLPWILYEQNSSTMKCSRGQLRNNSACCAHENAHVRCQLRTALNTYSEQPMSVVSYFWLDFFYWYTTNQSNRSSVKGKFFY